MQDKRILKLEEIKANINLLNKKLENFNLNDDKFELEEFKSGYITQIQEDLNTVYDSKLNDLDIKTGLSAIFSLTYDYKTTNYDLIINFIDTLVEKVKHNKAIPNDFWFDTLTALVKNVCSKLSKLSSLDKSILNYKNQIKLLVDFPIFNLVISKGQLYYQFTNNHGLDLNIPLYSYDKEVINSLYEMNRDDLNNNGYGSYNQYLNTIDATHEDVKNYINNIKNKIDDNESEYDIIDESLSNMLVWYIQTILHCVKVLDLTNVDDIEKAIKIIQHPYSHELTDKERKIFWETFRDMLAYIKQAINIGACEDINEAISFYNSKYVENNFYTFCQTLNNN